MKIIVLGVGGAFSPEIGNSSILLQDDNGSGFLVDCGYTVFPTLKEWNLLDCVDTIFITHKHGDHIGSLDTLLYYKRYVQNKKIKFYGLPNYDSYLKEIDPCFASDRSEFFVSEGSEIDMIDVLEVDHAPNMLSFAFTNFGLLYSGDTCKSLLKTQEAIDAKMIFHEVTFNPNVTVHTHFDELAKASLEVKAKTWLYHYNVGEDKIFIGKAIDAGFRGFLKQGDIKEI